MPSSMFGPWLILLWLLAPGYLLAQTDFERWLTQYPQLGTRLELKTAERYKKNSPFPKAVPVSAEQAHQYLKQPLSDFIKTHKGSCNNIVCIYSDHQKTTSYDCSGYEGNVCALAELQTSLSIFGYYQRPSGEYSIVLQADIGEWESQHSIILQTEISGKIKQLLKIEGGFGDAGRGYERNAFLALDSLILTYTYLGSGYALSQLLEWPTGGAAPGQELAKRGNYGVYSESITLWHYNDKLGLYTIDTTWASTLDGIYKDPQSGEVLLIEDYKADGCGVGYVNNEKKEKYTILQVQSMDRTSKQLTVTFPGSTVVYTLQLTPDKQQLTSQGSDGSPLQTFVNQKAR